MSDSTQSLPVTSKTLLLVGPVLIGSLISYFLFGISVVQLYIYHLSFPKDSRVIKSSVYAIFTLDIVQSVTVTVLAWHALCSGWGRAENLEFPGWSLGAIPTLSAIVSAWVQIFYAWRIRVLSDTWRIVPCIIIVLSITQACGAIGITAGFATLKDVAKLHLVKMYTRTIIWLGGAVLTDVIISVSMLYLLYNAKNSSFGHTQAMINRLIRLTVETGIATATTALVELILFQVFQENNLHLCVALSLCKVYSNAFMTSLNSRATTNSRGLTMLSSQRSQSGANATPRRIDHFSSAAVIHISTTTDRFDETEGSKSGIQRESIEMTGGRDSKMANNNSV